MATRTPTQAEYERNEAAMLARDLARVENDTLANRKAGASECHALMREAPATFARNSNWLFGGEYGFGARQRAWAILDSRSNRAAMLLQLLCALDCGSPKDGTNQAYNALTAAEKKQLGAVLDAALKDGAAIRARKIADGETMPNPAPGRYRYVVDLDERGSYRAHVENPKGKDVFTVAAGDELPEDDSSIFDDGFMRNKSDMAGLTEYLKDLKVMPASAPEIIYGG